MFQLLNLIMICEMIRFYVIVSYVLGANKVSHGYKYEDKKRLLDYLFDTSRYDKSIRPVKDSSTVTVVNISQSIRVINHIDVATGLMCSYTYLAMSWNDELLTWDSSDYGGITDLTLPSDKYWNPHLDKTYAGACKDTDVEKKEHISNTTVSNDGFVVEHQAKSIGAICLIDMTMFPFDQHLCVHQFYSSRYAVDELTVHFNQKSVIDERFYKENQEWSVAKTELNVTNFEETLSSLSVSYGSSLVTLRRRTAFIMINSFAPAWLVSVLIILAPLVPPDCERLSFIITTYLAMVFMNVSFVSEFPRNSIEIILLSKSMIAFSIISTIGIIWSIFIVCLSKMSIETRKVPDILRRMIKKRCNKTYGDGVSVERMDESEKSAEQNVTTNEVNNMTEDVVWYDVARFLDKIYFISSVIVYGLISFAIFINIDTY